MIQRIGIVGLGLMGASFGRLLTKEGFEVYGADLSPAVMEKALLAKAYSAPLTKETAPLLDLLVFAIYPRDFKKAAEEYLPYMTEGATVTDFCGDKTLVVKKILLFFP